jgi:hypothetical protein
MKKEELEKKLEGLDYPDIELPNHQRRLKMALLSSGRFAKRSFINFPPFADYVKEASMFKKVLMSAGAVALVAVLVVVGLTITTFKDSSQAQAQELVGKAISKVDGLSPDERQAVEQKVQVDLNRMLHDAKIAKDLAIVDRNTLDQEIIALNSSNSPVVSPDSILKKAIPDSKNLVTILRFTDRYGQKVTLGMDANNIPLWCMVDVIKAVIPAPTGKDPTATRLYKDNGDTPPPTPAK